MASITSFLHFFYAPHGLPWYQGNVWGNIVAVSILGPCGWFWAKSKFWPLKPLEREVDKLHKKHDAHAKSLEELHRKIDELMK